MRVTNNMVNNNLLKNLQITEKKMYDSQNQLSSSKRISVPSDDPLGTNHILALKSSLNRIQQWKNNADDATSYMNTADSIMGNMQSMLQRAQELALQASNGTLSDDERNAIKLEIDQINQQMVACANTKYGDKFLFAGTNNSTNPISDPTGTWLGNSEQINYEVGANLTIPANVDGVALFQSPQVKRQDGQSAEGLFQTLNDLSTAIGSNNESAISNLLQDINANSNNISLQRGDLGARENRLSLYQAQLDSMQTNFQQDLSSVQDVDVAKVATDFSNQSNVYKAAIATGAQIMQLSLVDFMK